MAVALERRCPTVVEKPAASRRIPDAIVQGLRALADEADDLLAEMRADEEGED